MTTCNNKNFSTKYALGEERVCLKCENPYEHFGQAYNTCRECKRIRERRLRATLTPESTKARAKIRGERKRARYDKILAYKALKGCCRCPEDDPVCLDLHHSDPTTKEFAVSAAVARDTPWNKIEEEMTKCVVICANCHRKLHAKLREEEKTTPL